MIGRRAGLLYALALALVAGARLAMSPIGEGDTDVWYHLNGGRYTVETGWPPEQSFFSFIDPPRVWTDYYWLFQILVYLLYTQFSFYGLIAVPAIAYLATLYFLYRLLARVDGPSPYVLAVFALYALFLLPRFHLVRPHLVTYLMIAAFIVLLDGERSRGRWLLPALAILWVNFHGVTYPVLLLIGVSYAAQYVVDRLRTGVRFTRADAVALAPIALAMHAVYLTPHGTRLLGVPFAPSGAASYYIAELSPLQLDDFLSFGLSTSNWSITYPTARNLLVALAGLALIRSVLARSLRLSHALMLAGGVTLLVRGGRFTYEFLLLVAPLLAATPLRWRPVEPSTRMVAAAAGILAAILPFTFLAAHGSDRPAYPVSQTHLPHGIVRFLHHVDVGGRVLNHPNNGGFLQWALADRYTIYMDMEVPFLFTNEDFYLVSQAFDDPTVLRRLVSRYEPDFIATPLRHARGARHLSAGAPDYVLVFFDDVEALYVDRRRHPALVERYGMTDVDPFSLSRGTHGGVASLEAIRPHVERMLELHPESGIANHIAGLVRQGAADHEAALQHADRIIAHHPQALSGYLLRADALKALGRLPEAITAYEAALGRAGGAARIGIAKRLGIVLFEGGMHERAYRVLRAATNVFDLDTSYQELYYLGAATFETGRVDQAAVILRFGLHKVPEGDESWSGRYRHYLTRLPEGT